MASHVVMPAVGFGVFVMMQRQMVGIRTRAERLARTRVTPPAPIRPDGPAEPRPAGEPMAPARPSAKGPSGPELVTATADSTGLTIGGARRRLGGRRRAVGRPDAVGSAQS